MKSRVVAYLWAILVAVSLAAQRQVTLRSEVEPDDTIADEQISAPEQSAFGTFGDSLGVRFLGSWPFGLTNVVAADGDRELVFCGAGGGVYVLDVSAPSEPEKVSEQIRTRGLIQAMQYDPTSRRLYLVTGYALEIWDVADITSANRLGSVALAGATELNVAGAYAYVVSDSGLRILSVLDPRSPREVGRCWLQGYPTDVAVSGRYAYVTDGEAGLRVIDVFDPVYPIQVAQCTLPEVSEPRLAKQGSHVYVVDDYYLTVIDVSNPLFPRVTAVQQAEGCLDALMLHGYLLVSQSSEPELQVYDVSNPTHPYLSLAATTFAGRLASAGNYVYVTGGSSGMAVVEVIDPDRGLHEVGRFAFEEPCPTVKLQGEFAYVAVDEVLNVVSFADPSSPELIGSCELPGGIRRIALYEHYVCVAIGDSGVRIVDVEDPANPREVGHVILPSAVNDVAVTAGYVLAATQVSGLRVVDLSEPGNPREVAACLEGGEVICVDTALGHAFAVTDDDTALYAVDIATPTNPIVVGWDTTPGEGSATRLCVAGNRVYLGAVAEIRIVDASDPTQLQTIGRSEVNYAEAQGLSVVDNVAYIAGYDEDLVVLDVSDPGAIRELARWYGRGYSSSLAVSGYYAAIGTEDDGLAIVDISSPVNTVTGVGQFIESSRAYDVAIANDFAFVADYSAGLKVIDVLHPETADEIGWLDTPGRAYQVKLSGSYAYIADYSTLRIVDVTDPANLRETGFCTTSARCYAVALADRYAFLACRGPGVGIVDVTDAANPREVGIFNTSNARDLVVQGSYLYVADYGAGLKILNISNPESLSLAGEIDPPGTGNVISVAVGGHYAYLGSSGNRVDVVDISDTANLRVVASVSLPDDANRLTLVGSRLYVGCDNYGLRIIDVSDTANVREVAHYDLEGQAWGVAVDGRRVYVADYSDGLQILGMLTGDLEESGAAAPLRFAARILCNPARGALRLSLTLPVVRDVSLQLLDVAGRAVNSWRVTGAKPGANAVTLPCKGIASGVYFLRAKAGSEVRKLKVVLTE